MSEPKMYWKASHKCYYVTFGGKQTRLDPDEEKARTLYHTLMLDKAPVKSTCPVVAILDRFLEHCERNTKPATYEFYRDPVKSFAKCIGPKLQVKDLKAHHVTKWLDGFKTNRGKNRGKQVNSANYHHNLVRAIKAPFNWAVKEERLEVSPLRNYKNPYRTRPRDVYLMPEQWDKLVAAVAGCHDRGCLLDIITVMKETGCRPLEARSVEKHHFDQGGKCWVFPADESKGEREPRVVLLNDKALALCQRLALKHPEGPLFRNSDGKPWSRQTLDYRLYRLSKKLGFRCCPYAVRHTFCTEAIIRGVDIQTVATLMGHVDLKMVSRIYQHIRKRSDHLRAGLRKAVGA
jgi:integrase